ncbi:alpha/beta hydrolase [Leifsonia sp. 2TAF2]|uniref:alpha/beta hydrolase n=1 Tax=Leifsonia sp. 2TAF2 TaxID=3233009 RepID=UPI003F9C248F
MFSPPHAVPTVTSASNALSQRGLGAHDVQAEEIIKDLRTATPEAVAAEWADAPAELRESVRDSLPLVYGNLGGLPYAVRDRLNRRALASRIAVMQQRAASTGPGRGQAAASLAAYRAIEKALRPRRQLVALTADASPLAAISVGNLDTASEVTWLIPGMGTYSTDMPLWTLAARNLYEAQGRVGAAKKRAVIAWMGYQPPPPPPSIEAARGFYAEQGAPNLVRDLTALRATRSTGKPVTALNVVAHSYGTTLTADALASADLGIHSVVMLGSAGIEPAVGDATALHAESVYVGESSRDPVASLGQFSRRDPRSPAFGAIVFGCDGAAAEHLKAVTGHEPVLHSAWNDNPKSSLWAKIRDAGERIRRFLSHTERFGYLDRGTESLANTASATTLDATRAITHQRLPSTGKRVTPF